jgi:hypothetical protein
MSLETVTHIADLTRTNPTSSDPISQGDNHIQNLKIALTNDFTGFAGAVCVTGTDGGAANAYTLTPTTALPAYGTKMLVVFAPTVTNTTACTMNISALGVKDIKSIAGAALTAGDLVFGEVYLMLYTGTEFRLTGITKNYVDQLALSASLPGQPGGSSTYHLVSIAGSASWEIEPVIDEFTDVAVAALEIDCSLSNFFTKTIAGDSTFTFANVPSNGYMFTLLLTYTSGVITWPASVEPSDDVFPTLATGKSHLLTFITFNGGTRFYVSVNRNYTT